MKLNFGMKKNSSDMLVLYITVGIVFVLITVMNIYAYSKIRAMSSDYTSFGEISKELRHDLVSAENNLAEIVLKGKSLDLKKHVYSHLEKAHAKAKELGKISNLKLDKNISQFETLAPEAYSQNNPAVKKQKMDQCSRLVKNAVDRLNASDEERTALIQNETHFIGYIYIVLIIGNILAFAGIFFVIFVNERNIRNKETKLNSVNANFHAVMQGLDSVLITFDSSGIIQSWNGNAERYFELKNDEAVGKNIYELVPSFKALKAFFDKVIYSQQRHYNFHERMHINKGILRIVDMLCVPLISSGKGKKAQKALLVKIDDVTTFATEEAHQVRVRGAQLIGSGMDLVMRESAALQQQAEGIINAVNEISEARGVAAEITPYTSYLSSTLSEWTALPQKYVTTLAERKFNNVQIDLNELIMYTLRICLKTFDPSINVEVSQNESKSWIMADPAALSRAMFCLLNNAAEALTEMKPEGEEPGGIISVSVEKISGETLVSDRIMRFRHAVKEPPYWVVMISDNGVGIPPEIQPSMYDLFFTTKDPEKHKGLGLSIVANIINGQGGYFDVNSRPGNGTVFKIYLPEMPGVSEEAESEQTSNLTGDDSNIVYGQGNILFVSDDIFLSEITTRLMEKFGYSVIYCDNCYKALNMYADSLNTGDPVIHCVISNLTSGSIRDAQLVSSLKQMNPACNIAVLVDSEADETIAPLRELGVNDFIKKPYSMPDFSRILSQYAVSEPAADSTDAPEQQA